MIPDRIIEQGTLTTSGERTAVEVRLPWYRALPGSCIAGAKLTVDGVAAPEESLRWRMNDREFRFDSGLNVVFSIGTARGDLGGN